MRLFGKRLGWGMKLWFGSWLLMFPLMLLGEVIDVPLLFFAYGALLGFVLLPTLNTIDGRNKNRGGKGIKGIMWEDD